MKLSFTRFCALTLVLLSSVSIHGQHPETEIDGLGVKELYVETRFGFEGKRLDGTPIHDNTGFRGQYLNLRLEGQITHGLTYSYRQRLNKLSGKSFFDATDWIHLDWQMDSRWAFSAGKQVVAIGGYEYDRAPIDLYYCSEFWNHIPCYQLGVSASCQVAPADRMLLQLVNSPLRSWAGGNTYGVNLMWYGKHAWWETMWSFNMMEHQRGRWINYLALGNRFWMGERLHLDVDWMNRASSHQDLLSDFSVMSELSLQAHATTRCFLGYTYDQNKSGTDADMIVQDGTRLNRASAGVEVSPLRRYPQCLRAFAVMSYSWGTNTNPQGVTQDRQLLGQVGIKFKLDILQGIRHFSANTNKK